MLLGSHDIIAIICHLETLVSIIIIDPSGAIFGLRFVSRRFCRAPPLLNATEAGTHLAWLIRVCDTFLSIDSCRSFRLDGAQCVSIMRVFVYIIMRVIDRQTISARHCLKNTPDLDAFGVMTANIVVASEESRLRI